MPPGWRHRHRLGGPPCPGGKLSRFVEPSVLLALQEAGEAHGYHLAEQARQLGLSDASLDGGAVYRALRELEAEGCVASTWDTSGSGPARRLYQLTPVGRERLAAWIGVLRARAAAMQTLVERYDALPSQSPRSGDGAPAARGDTASPTGRMDGCE
jgi:poly-beta-hydroxybutyrate-responsive repressor